MNSPAEVIRQLLIDHSLGVDGQSEDWCIFVSFLPAHPDTAICVYDTAGRKDGRIMRTGEQIEHPGIQILVRGLSHSEAWTKVQEIVAALDSVMRLSVATESGSKYIIHGISRTGSVMSLGVEEEGDRRRRLFTINATITTEE